MISCKQCGTHNSLDSTFCRKCGAAVTEAEVEEARAKLDLLTAEGNVAFNEGRTDEALAIAQNVLESDPDSIPALWLKAICHERKDEIAAALDCAERIVELNPDSELDKIRRNQLRTKLASQLQVYEKPDRRVALVGAVAAGVLMLCVGALAATSLRGRSTEGAVVQNQAKPNLLEQTSRPNNQAAPQQPALQTPNTGAGVTQANQNTGHLEPGDVGAIRDASPDTPKVKIPEYSGAGQLPSPSGTGEVKPIDPRDFQVNVTPQNGGNQQAEQPPAKKQGDDPTQTFPTEGSKTNAEANTGNDGGGSIEIAVHTGGGPTGGGEANGAKAQTISANEAFLLGNYAKAASLLEQALRNGGDPVGLNQRLGQAYEKVGKRGDALAAYQRAVQAGEAAINSGRGNPDRLRSVVESCQQAIRNLGG